jgi:hypothetical protein
VILCFKHTPDTLYRISMKRLSVHRFVLPLICVTLNLTSVLNAEVPAESEAPDQSPPPELERISSAVGVWDITASYRSTPDARLFNGRCVETIRLSPNGRFFISDEHILSPDGWKNELVITTWNQAKKEYRLLHVNNAGDTVEASMVVQGNTRTVLFYSRFERRLVRNEMTVEFVSDAEYKFRSVCTDREKTWIFCEGIGKKRK